MSIRKKAAGIKLLLFDVDGVLTDGKILLHADGTESKQFDIRDGTGLVWAQKAGLQVGFLVRSRIGRHYATRRSARHLAGSAGRRKQATSA